MNVRRRRGRRYRFVSQVFNRFQARKVSKK